MVVAAGPRVLLVEDDAQLAGMLEELLASEGYDVELALDGQRGLHLGLTREYAAMVLDRGLPVLEGLDLLARFRARGVHTPVLVLSALASPRDKVAGLDAGAEDYLGKPFDLEELLARLRALVRRQDRTGPRVVVPGGHLEADQRVVILQGGGTVELSGREAGLLEVLARQPRRVFSRSDLLALVFPTAEEPNAVDTYVHYLRKKLGRGVVTTVHGLGYRLGAL
jgi:two-component system, OmpR family, response regulator QseB